ncbi:MAG TPA: DUF2231 domain-containing protein [Dehalococcoidia bacterium]|nr:DUF2231 domain-containing protein [Dehalococcoidia bacterium]
MRTQSIWSQKPIVGGRWTVKDVVQGKPLHHPSHPMFVHFPSALFPVALLLDVISLFDPSVAVTRAAFYNIAAGLVMAGGAALTGLVDYLPMVGGSRKKKLGTYHLVAQLVAVSAMGVSLALRALDFDTDQTGAPALAAAAIGVGAMVFGNYFGGVLVYRQGMRVSTE